MKKLLLPTLILFPLILVAQTKNIVPRADGQGSIGTLLKAWGDVHADSIFLNNSSLHTLLNAKQPLDADLTDLADGELTGSKVGTGIAGDNIVANSIDETEIDEATLETGLEAVIDINQLQGELTPDNIQKDAQTDEYVLTYEVTGDSLQWAVMTGGGAPTSVDYLVGTADGTLTNEIVVGTTPGGELGGTWDTPTLDNDALDDQYYDSEADLTGLLDDNYQPLEATLTDIADGTIVENLVNTSNPWAENEIISTMATESEANTWAYRSKDSATVAVTGIAKVLMGNSGSGWYQGTMTQLADTAEVAFELKLDLPDLQGVLTDGQILAGIHRDSETKDGDLVSFDDQDANFTAADVDEALEELDDVIGGGFPNQTTGKVDWSELVNVPAGFADNVDAAAGGIDSVGQDTSPTLGGDLDLNDKSLKNTTPTFVVTATEISYLDGVTSAIQTQIDGKQPLDADLTTIAGLTATTDNFLISVSSAWASRTPTQAKVTLALDNVTNESKATMFISPTFTGTVTIPTPFTLGATSVTTTGTQLNYLNASTGTTGTTSTNIVFSTSPTFTTSIIYANSADDDILGTAGASALNTTDEQLSFHSAADGEISGEVSVSLILHKTWSFDPDAVCDGAVDRLFLMTILDDLPEGMIIDEWKVSFEADPTTEADADLKYADAFIGVANSAVIDALDTTAGTSTEDTDANINSGNAIANGKVLYIEFATAYTESNHQIIFEIWYHAEED